MTKNLSSLASASLLAFGLGVVTMPSVAHAGFLEQLFGVAPQQTPQAAPMPTYGSDEPSFTQSAPVHHRVKRRLVVDSKPKLQKPTDLMHDITLQNGDAVMMKGGIEIYTGDNKGARHSEADFASIDAVDAMPKQERRALLAMDVTRNDPLRDIQTPDTVASGRSAAVANPVVAGHPIVDASGKTVRYVGP